MPEPICNHCHQYRTNCGCGNYNVPLIPNPFGDCGCEGTNPCPVQLDATCVFYNKYEDGASLLQCIDMPNGSALNRILEAFDEKLCQVQVVNFNSFDLPCLRGDFTVTNIQEFAEGVDAKMCGLQASLITIQNSLFSLSTSLNTTIVGIQFPQLVDNCFLGILTTDSIGVVLQKIMNKLCEIINNQVGGGSGNEFSLSAQNSNSMSLMTAGENGDNLIGDVQVSADANNAIEIRTDGLYAPIPVATIQVISYNPVTRAITLSNGGGSITLPTDADAQTLTFNEITKVLNISGGNGVDLSSLIAQNPTMPISATATQSINITPSGDFGHTLSAAVRIDPASNNSLHVTENGLLATDTDEKVKSNASDTLAGYLEDKLLGLPDSCVTTSITTNPSTFKQEVKVTIDKPTLAGFILSEILTQDTLRELFRVEARKAVSVTELQFGIPSLTFTTGITSFKLNGTEQLSARQNDYEIQLPIGSFDMEFTVESGYDTNTPRKIVIIDHFTGNVLACQNYVVGTYTYTFPAVALNAFGVLITTLPGTC